MFHLALSAIEEGAEGPQKGPKGPAGPKGNPALQRSYKEGHRVPQTSIYTILHNVGLLYVCKMFSFKYEMWDVVKYFCSSLFCDKMIQLKDFGNLRCLYDHIKWFIVMLVYKIRSQLLYLLYVQKYNSRVNNISLY